MHNQPSTNYELAVRDFQRARKSAVLRQILARLRGRSDALLDYETIRQQLKPTDRTVDHGISEIPLDKIVGSVGRYHDFTREFLPKQPSDQNRWAAVKAAMTEMAGLPPIEVYQIGDAYFVLDGNHRVSVARKSKAQTISAHVTEIKTRVALSANDDPDEVICKARYANFLEQTNLDQRFPDIDLLMTLAGHYQTLLSQIEFQHQRMLAENERESLPFWVSVHSPSSAELVEAERPLRQAQGAERLPSLEDAASAWYESIYLPVIQLLRELGVMRRFPKRTETDIYLLLSQRREELEQALGCDLVFGEALPALAQSESQAQIGTNYLAKAWGVMRPSKSHGFTLDSWRTEQIAIKRGTRLFADMLILFEGIDEDWALLEAALWLGAVDHDRILALYIVDNPADLESPLVDAIAERFYSRCQEAGLVGGFVAEAGDAVHLLLRHAAWSDLVFINLTHPPESTIRDRLRSFWGPVITRSPRPLLIAPHARFNGMDSILLAYDGSRKAEEALFVATYHATRWGHMLTVLTVETAHTAAAALTRAREYLASHNVQADYVLKKGQIGEAVLETASDIDATLIIMGGFGASPALRLLQGSTVEYVLQHVVDQVVLICQ